MSRQLRPPPPPLEGNDQVITAVGTICWAVALVVVVVLRHHIPGASRWWIWTCVVGLGLGLFALAYIPRLKRSRAKTAARRAEARR